MSLQFLKNALQNNNVKAFMMTVRISEGTSASDGYNYLFGSSPHNTLRFTDFSKHPNIKEKFGVNNFSTAAGAYQILYGTWITIQSKYNLPDFSPASQDIACAELISERNVLQSLMDGDFDAALHACSSIWASLPFNDYSQPTHPVNQYAIWYKDNGGTIA